MGAHTKGPRASVRVFLVNPESGYESDTEATVSADQWAVIDAVLCGREQPYASAPDLLEALQSLIDNLAEGDFISETRIAAARAAIAKATGEA